MAWSGVHSWTTGELVTASIMTTYINNNLLATAPAIVTTAGDITYASGANTLARLAIGNAGNPLYVASGLPAWNTNITFTSSGGATFNDNVGIGMVPSNALDVAGNGRISGTLTLAGVAATIQADDANRYSTAAYRIQATSGHDATLVLSPGTSNTGSHLRFYNTPSGTNAGWVDFDLVNTSFNISAVNAGTGSKPTTLSFGGFASGYLFDQKLTVSSGGLAVTGQSDLGVVRATGTSVGGSGGAGVELWVNSGDGELSAFNRGSSAYINQRYDAAQHIWYVSATEGMRLDWASNWVLGSNLNTTAVTKATIYSNTNGDGLTIQASATGNTALINLRGSQGSVGAPSDVVSGNTVGSIAATAYSGGTWFAGGQINMVVDGTFTSGQRPPSRIDFYTNLANTAQSINLRLDSSGNLIQTGGYYSIGTNPAGAGMIRLGNSSPSIYVRNHGNSADLHVWYRDVSSDTMYFGSDSGTTYIESTGTINFRPNGSGTLRGYFGGSGGFIVGTGATVDQGAGTINVATGIYLAGSAYTNPDYVFEHAYTGTIVKNKKEPGAAEYDGLLSFDALREYLREHWHLPGFSREHDLFRRAGHTLEKVEEAYLYLLNIDSRIRQAGIV